MTTKTVLVILVVGIILLRLVFKWLGWRMPVRPILILAAVGIVIAAVNFGRTPEEKLKAGVAVAMETFIKLRTDTEANAAFQQHLRRGKTPATYVKENLEDSTLGPFVMDKPNMLETVVLRQSADNEIVIEGYLKDLAKPYLTETVSLPPREALISQPVQ